MNFEKRQSRQEQITPDFSKIYEKKTSELRDFLDEQMSLPKKEWNDKFKKYIEEKADELKLEIPERTPEEDQKLTFKKYLKGLDLNEEELKNKKILDIGCGEEGEFIEECLKEGITDEAYGLDMKIKPEKFEGNSEHFLKGLMQEDILIKDTDYTLSVGAISLAQTKESIEKVLLRAVDTLKEFGELRIWPIPKMSPDEKELNGFKEKRENWIDVLDNLFLEGEIEYELKPIDIRVSGKNKDVWLQEVLIIKKIKEKNLKL